MSATVRRLEVIETQPKLTLVSNPVTTEQGHPAVIALPAVKSLALQNWQRRGRDFLTAVLPPLLVLIALLVIWEIATSGAKATLPSPIRIWKEASDLILNPFFVNGPQDIGLGYLCHPG